MEDDSAYKRQEQEILFRHNIRRQNKARHRHKHSHKHKVSKFDKTISSLLAPKFGMENVELSKEWKT